MIARGRTNAIKMAARCENPAESVVIYSGNGIFSFPRAATWHFLSNCIIIYPLGFIGEQASFVVSHHFVFDGAETFYCHGGHSAPPLGEHFDWLELNEKNPQFFCSYKSDSLGLAAIARADPRVIEKLILDGTNEVILDGTNEPIALPSRSSIRRKSSRWSL